MEPFSGNAGARKSTAHWADKASRLYSLHYGENDRAGTFQSSLLSVSVSYLFAERRHESSNDENLNCSRRFHKAGT